MPDVSADSLTKQREDMGRAIERMPFPIALVADEGWILYCSDSFSSLVKYPKDELLTKRWQDITHPEDIAEDQGQHEAIASGKISYYSMRKRYICYDDRIIWISLTVGYIRSLDLAIATVYDISDKVRAEQAQELDNRVLQGILDSEFEMHYQPILRLKTRETVGWEALVRWNRSGELLTPGAFLFEPLSKITLLQLFLETAKLVAEKIDTLESPLWLALNVSARMMGETQDDMLPRFQHILSSYDVDPARLRLEITEEELINEPWMLAALKVLRSRGHHIELDDFGTERSNLIAIRNYPIQAIKIDRSLVNDLPDSPEAESLVRAVIAMCKALGLEIIAEGIEDEEQARWLQYNGCDYGQGFLFSEPLKCLLS